MADTDFAAKIIDGDVRSAARVMRAIEDGRSRAFEILDKLHKHTGSARITGITGLPGSGKSTLINRLISTARQEDITVGCIAVDPTSPFSGGAVLGDRIRMQQHSDDRGVFIRSVATRGTLGGISKATPALIQILDAMGFDWIIIETVGVGQSEVDIMHLADTNVVVLVPGLGDDVQLSKAGLLESGDILTMNKADKEGVVQYRQQIKELLRDTGDESGWDIPLAETIATNGEGIDKLFGFIRDHQTWLDESLSATQRRSDFFFHFLRLVCRSTADTRVLDYLDSDTGRDILNSVVDGDQAPFETAETLLQQIANRAD
jgi:LAO/AO transport system kinase